MAKKKNATLPRTMKSRLLSCLEGSQWKNKTGNERYIWLTYADRGLALIGGRLFSALFVAGIIIAPIVSYCWYLLSLYSWELSLTIAIATCVIASQCLLAFLRQAYFYDELVTGLFGCIFAAIMIVIDTVASGLLCRHYNVELGTTVIVVIVFGVVQAALVYHAFMVY